MISKIDIIKKLSQIALHIIFWIAVLLFFTYFFSANGHSFQDTFKFALFLMPTTIATTYVATYILIPNYLINKRYSKFILYSLYTLIISSYLVFVSVFFSLIYLSNFEYKDMNPATKNVLFIMTAIYLVVIIVSAFKLLKLNLEQASKTKSLETKILDTQLKLKEQELQYLKMQIHPHFLFNTLNTLYGFALQKSDRAPEMILKLSNLLDYLLYQIEKPKVPLSEEIAHIQDYIDLENMRFNETLEVNTQFKTSSNDVTIAPMLLLPFVENSFKHGSIEHGKLKINIELSSTRSDLHFKITNTQKPKSTSEHGIGLENITKRLELLYPDQYELSINDKSALYKVDLKIRLN